MTAYVSATMPSPVGTLTFVASDEGLRAVLWEHERGGRSGLGDEIARRADHPILVRAIGQVGEYLAGNRTVFDLPLDLRGTEFQCRAWRALADIPFGQTATYRQQAERIGHPSAVRAVGAANGKNPIPIILPCHRVIGSDGSLTGFGGGLPAKRFLLDHEAGRLTVF